MRNEKELNRGETEDWGVGVRKEGNIGCIQRAPREFTIYYFEKVLTSLGSRFIDVDKISVNILTKLLHVAGANIARSIVVITILFIY